MNIFSQIFQVKKEARRKEQKKYTVKPPKDLRSKFEIMLEERKRKEEESEISKRKKEEEEKLAVSINNTQFTVKEKHKW